MKTYTPASGEVRARVTALIARHHVDLNIEGVRIDLLFVSSDVEGPALMHQGYPAAAIVRPLGPKERAMDRGDAEIVIDESGYMNMGDAEKDALLDHELYHIELCRNPFGNVKRDCCARPKLKMRKHDRQYGWFDAIAKRHGEASGEVRQAQLFKRAVGQIYFDFATRETATTHAD